MIRNIFWRTLSVLSVALLGLAPAASLGSAVANAAALAVHAAGPAEHPNCDNNAFNCTEVFKPIGYDGKYTGHDEPSLLFYSNTPGSGNSNVYHLTLPTDPPTLPRQDGTGGTFNFQLHPAFWFGMALCDTQSAPNPGRPCNPDTDANILDGSNPAAADYIGKHPGAAFMEMQFYPPGGPAAVSCDATKWCAALNIFSFSENMNTGEDLNETCQDLVGLEYTNFAFVTKSGVPHAPANPMNSTLDTFTPNPATDLLMNSGDELLLTLHDTPAGFQVAIKDKSTGQSGSMTASSANTFGQVKFAPTGTACENIPYDFHPMYATSSEHTRVPWAAHTSNVAFSDEIGHFEYCSVIDPATGACTAASASDPAGPDADDVYCFSPADSLRIAIGGCSGTDLDFDGVAYQHTWPGSLSNRQQDQRLNPRPITFSSPLFKASSGEGSLRNYSRVAFEADLPRIELTYFGGTCDAFSGAGCVNPPQGANFYPIYTTRGGGGGDSPCLWQLGGANIPGTTNTFGGNSTAEFGALLLSTYPTWDDTPIQFFQNFRRVLSSNPCPENVSE